jgi:hypothetical protein
MTMSHMKKLLVALVSMRKLCAFSARLVAPDQWRIATATPGLALDQ